jgi:SAM-dependent methyltransferase
MEVRVAYLMKSLLTHLPGLRAVTNRGTGGTDSARYCYSVWLRHLIKAHEAGIAVPPRSLAELGPGDSLGVGLAAVLSGVGVYYAADVKPYAELSRNLNIFDELITLFNERADVPGPDEFPGCRPSLRDYRFPHAVLTADRLEQALRPTRLEQIRELLRHDPSHGNGIQIQYAAPWDDPRIIPAGTVDMILSQAVLEHVEDVPLAYEAMARWLRPGGYMSHTIDFRSHGITHRWNGHWALSDRMWRLVKGGRTYLINREPCAEHLRQIERVGMHVVGEERAEGPALEAAAVAPRFRGLSELDLRTQGVFVQATKPAMH